VRCKATVARLNQNSIRVNGVPLRKKEDEDAALAIPLSFSGTPEELEAEIAKSLVPSVEENLRLRTTLGEPKAEMEATAKADREQVKSKSTHSTKKAEETPAAGQIPSTTTPAEQNMSLFATQQK
jgi:PRTRC genetic system protein E